MLSASSQMAPRILKNERVFPLHSVWQLYFKSLVIVHPFQLSRKTEQLNVSDLAGDLWYNPRRLEGLWQ